MLRRMRDDGSIIQISSATASIMLEDHAAYMGTKAGTDHVIRCVANEFGHRGIRANSIAPGFTPTPMTAKASRNQAILDTFAKEYPLGRVGTSDDIADGIGREHVCTPVPNAHLVCRLLLKKKNRNNTDN